MATLSSFVGIKKPQVSKYSESGRLFQAEVDTSQVLGAFAEDALQGEGTLYQDSRANQFEAAVKQATNPLTEDEWKSSANFRKGLTYHPGMDDHAAQILAETEDDRNERQLIMEKATGWQTTAGFGASLAVGIVEPKNIASGVAAAVLTGGVGALATNSMRLGKVIKQFNSIGKYKRVAALAAAEGFTAAAMTEPSNRESSKILQGDYTMADTLMNFGLSTVLGAGFGVAGKGLEMRARGKKLEGIREDRQIIQAYRAERDDIAVKEFDAATSQLAQGSNVDIEHVGDIERSNYAEKFTSIKLDEVRTRAEAAVVERKKGRFEVRLEDETGVMRGAFGEGRTAQEAIDDIVGQYNNTKAPTGKASEIDPQVMAHTVEIERLRNTLSTPESSIKRFEAAGLHLDTLNKLKEQLSEAEAHANELKSSTKGRKQEKAMALMGESPKQKAEQLKIEINAISGKKIATVNKAIAGDDAAIKRQIRDLESKIIKIQQNSVANKPSIARSIEGLTKPDNSTAYNPNDSLDIQKYLDEAGDMEDQIRLEQEFEGMKEEIAELKGQGLLNDEELGILENLSNIDKESAIYDNILLNAKICLTRG